MQTQPQTRRPPKAVYKLVDFHCQLLLPVSGSHSRTDDKAGCRAGSANNKTMKVVQVLHAIQPSQDGCTPVPGDKGIVKAASRQLPPRGKAFAMLRLNLGQVAQYIIDALQGAKHKAGGPAGWEGNPRLSGAGHEKRLLSHVVGDIRRTVLCESVDLRSNDDTVGVFFEALSVDRTREENFLRHSLRVRGRSPLYSLDVCAQTRCCHAVAVEWGGLPQSLRRVDSVPQAVKGTTVLRAGRWAMDAPL